MDEIRIRRVTWIPTNGDAPVPREDDRASWTRVASGGSSPIRFRIKQPRTMREPCCAPRSVAPRPAPSAPPPSPLRPALVEPHSLLGTGVLLDPRPIGDAAARRLGLPCPCSGYRATARVRATMGCAERRTPSAERRAPSVEGTGLHEDLTLTRAPLMSSRRGDGNEGTLASTPQPSPRCAHAAGPDSLLPTPDSLLPTPGSRLPAPDSRREARRGAPRRGRFVRRRRLHTGPRAAVYFGDAGAVDEACSLQTLGGRRERGGGRDDATRGS
uniref:Uncharacterized protein n=1 Tax=Mycena belliarum TaxID=1033014 RepID=A0AAD6XNK1_9AGAR|nr:hypothetical protein B0H15DRAFT_955298 [Mycena belliae]